MDKNKINEALNYAKGSIDIENMSITKEELKEIRNSLLEGESDKSFIEKINSKTEKFEEEGQNGKNK